MRPDLGRCFGFGPTESRRGNSRLSSSPRQTTSMQSTRLILHYSRHLSPRFPTNYPHRALLFSQKRLISRNVPQSRPESSSSQASPLVSLTSDKGKEKEAAVDGDSVVEAMEKEQDRLPFLQRPLGVPEPPTTEPQSWKDEMMNQEVRMDHRRKLWVYSNLF